MHINIILESKWSTFVTIFCFRNWIIQIDTYPMLTWKLFWIGISWELIVLYLLLLRYISEPLQMHSSLLFNPAVSFSWNQTSKDFGLLLIHTVMPWFFSRHYLPNLHVSAKTLKGEGGSAVALITLTPNRRCEFLDYLDMLYRFWG